MPPRLPAKPRTSPLITRTLVAMALGAPACGIFGGGASRIGPTPIRIGPPPMRIGPPPCYDAAFVLGTVFVGEQRERLANHPVTLSINGVERILTTDGQGQFKLDRISKNGGGTTTATVSGYDTVNVVMETNHCEPQSEMLILLKPAGSPDIPPLQGRGNGIVIHE